MPEPPESPDADGPSAEGDQNQGDQDRNDQNQAGGEGEESAQALPEASPRSARRPTPLSQALPLEALAAGYLQARSPWGGSSVPDEVRAVAAREQPLPPRGLLPLQSPTVNRLIPPDVAYVDIPIEVGGQVVRILRRERSFPSGPLTGDPAPLAGPAGPCHVLSPRAAVRCVRGGGRF